MIILTNTGFSGTQTQTRAVHADAIIGYQLENESADGVGHLLLAERVDGSVVPLIRKGSEDECLKIIDLIESNTEDDTMDFRIKHRQA